jgi:hypothetical protein
MADPVKRLRYFDGEFLKAADFKAEQDYHVGLRRGQNRTLWVAGIADGLDVVASGTSAVVVKAGRAIDSLGRDVVLANDSAPVDLSAIAVGTQAWVTIAYAEQDSDPSAPPSAQGNTRVTEQPQVVAAIAAPADPAMQLVVGRATRTAAGLTVDTAAPRRTLEPKALGALRQDVASRLSASGGTVANLTVSGALSVSGSTALANVAFSGKLYKGTTNPQRDLHIEGTELHSGGAGGGFSFANRGGGYVENGGTGDRWVLYAGDKKARLWSAGDKLTIDSNGAMALVGNLGTRGYSPVSSRGWGGGIHTWDVEAEASIWAHNGIWCDGLLSINGPTTLNGATINGGAQIGAIFVGRDGNGVDYPWEYETIGVAGTAWNLRMQSPNNVVTHAFGQERMWFDSVGNVLVRGKGNFDMNQITVPGWSGGGLASFDLFAQAWVYADGVQARVKKFSIDHPLEPEKRNLVHTSLEGPEVGVYYRGQGRLEDGRVVIELPSYFEALTRSADRSVLITPKLTRDGRAIPVLAASEVEDGCFTVAAAGEGNPDQPFYWEVKAVRADLDALEVEPVKRDVRAAEPVAG